MIVVVWWKGSDIVFIKKNNMAKEKVIRLSHRMLVHQQKSEDPVLHDQISLLA